MVTPDTATAIDLSREEFNLRSGQRLTEDLAEQLANDARAEIRQRNLIPEAAPGRRADRRPQGAGGGQAAGRRSAERPGTSSGARSSSSAAPTICKTPGTGLGPTWPRPGPWPDGSPPAGPSRSGTRCSKGWEWFNIWRPIPPEVHVKLISNQAHLANTCSPIFLWPKPGNRRSNDAACKFCHVLVVGLWPRAE